MSTNTQNPETVPQAATGLLDVCVDAILRGDLGKPIEEWLKAAHNDLSLSAQRQVTQILLFLDVLGDSRRLVPEVQAWRTDREVLCAALVARVRHAYVSAGCQQNQADLIGSPLLSKESIGRLLQFEPPFQRLENPGTRNNAIRFVCHVHEAIAKGTLVAPQDSAPQAPEPGEPRREGPRAEPRTPPAESPTFHDQGAIVNPKRYRVVRVRRDVWVYANVQFERPEGATDLAWLSSLGPAEQARWLEQLAAALLDEADALSSQAAEQTRGM